MRITLNAADITMSAADRTITGNLAVFGAEGNGSMGRVRFEAGAIKPPADLKRVKLLVEHDTERPVGFLVRVATEGAAMVGEFYVPTGEHGDAALGMAADGLRDGLSVGVDVKDHHKDGETLVITDAMLREVSLVAVPALDDARVISVTQSDNPVTEPEEKDEQMPATEETAAPVVEQTATETPAEQTAQTVAAANAKPLTMGQAPTMDLKAAVKTAAEVFRSGSASRLEMALGAITAPDDAGEGVLRPQWVGELWEASLVERPLIDAMGTRPLTGLKVQGFRKQWGDLVDSWDPDTDAQIPSPGTFVTEPVEEDTGYYAGGNAIDRRYVDLGTPGFVQSWFTAATDSYKTETEAAATAGFVAQATTIAAQPDLLTALDVLARAASGRGANLDFLVMGATIWSQFVGLKPDEVPWWLQAQGQVSLIGSTGSAAGVSFKYGYTLGATQILAGDRRAAKWYEVAPPISVQALDVAGGKVDVAVYGYGALLVEDPASIFQTTVTP